jgi:hypothetical protein
LFLSKLWRTVKIANDTSPVSVTPAMHAFQVYLIPMKLALPVSMILAMTPIMHALLVLLIPEVRSDTEHICHLTCWIPNLFDTEVISYQAYLKPNFNDTKHNLYRTYLIPN